MSTGSTGAFGSKVLLLAQSLSYRVIQSLPPMPHGPLGYHVERAKSPVLLMALPHREATAPSGPTPSWWASSFLAHLVWWGYA